MRLIICLGNPGRKYAGTPHNLGFEIADLLSQRAGLVFKSSLKYTSCIAKGTLAGCETILLKPATFMNRSGDAVSRFLRYHPVPPSDILVITDDINLPLGRLRFRERGSHGGHKGLLSIIQTLDTGEFPRLRIGIKSQEEVEDYIKYVLTPFRGEERERIARMKILAADAVEYYLSNGLSKAASHYNRQTPLEQDI